MPAFSPLTTLLIPSLKQRFTFAFSSTSNLYAVLDVAKVRMPIGKICKIDMYIWYRFAALSWLYQPLPPPLHPGGRHSAAGSPCWDRGGLLRAGLSGCLLLSGSASNPPCYSRESRLFV